MTSEDICGKCGTPIPKDSEVCPHCPVKPKKTAPLPIFLIIGVLCSSLLLLTSSVVNVATLPTVQAEKVESAPVTAPVENINLAAYEAAKGYIEELYPGPKRFSELYQSSVEQKGNVYTVTLSSDDLGGTSPVRYFFSVEMELTGNTWTLKQLKR